MDFLECGKIVRPHGVKGTVKVMPWADSAEFLLNFDTFYIEGKPYEVRDSFTKDGFVFLLFENVSTISDAEALRGKIVNILRDDVELPEGVYFERDIIGLEVYERGELLGKVTEILRTGANDVYVVKNKDGRELLLPVIDGVILSIDVTAGRIEASVPDGLR